MRVREEIRKHKEERMLKENEKHDLSLRMKKDQWDSPDIIASKPVNSVSYTERVIKTLGKKPEKINPIAKTSRNTSRGNISQSPEVTKNKSQIPQIDTSKLRGKQTVSEIKKQTGKGRVTFMKSIHSFHHLRRTYRRSTSTKYLIMREYRISYLSIIQLRTISTKGKVK